MSDSEILQAAFKQARQLQVLYADAIPWSAIEKGFYYKDKKVHFASKAIGIFKPSTMSKGLISIKTVIPKAGRFNIYNDHQSSDDYYHYSLQERGVACVQNGIALSKLHHTAYDRQLIGIDADFKIHVSDEVMAENDGPLLEDSIKGLNGKKLIVPAQKALRPNKDHLAERFEAFLKAN